MASLHLALDPEADTLLAEDPLALLIGMVLDQQVPMERAFAAPAALRRRLGHLDPAAIAAADPDGLAATFAERPALHRFPGAMARRVQELCRVVVDAHGGRAAAIWADAGSGDELVRRLQGLPGFGAQKARIFGALLGKQLGVRPPGWEEATAPYGEPGTLRSVADIVDDASLAAVRAAKAEMKAAARAGTAPAGGKRKAAGGGGTGAPSRKAR